MYEICGEKTNFSPLILHIFPIFPRPGNKITDIFFGLFKKLQVNSGLNKIFVPR